MTQDKKHQELDEAKKQRNADIEDFRFVAGDARGRRFLRRLIEQSGVYHISFAGEETHATAFNEGKRNLGLLLINEIAEITPDLWVQIMKGN